MEELLIDTPGPALRRLLINRPESRNAINANLRTLLFEALATARDDPAVRAVILGGAGGIFCSGGDLPSMVGISAEAAAARMAEGHRIVRLLWSYPKPVIAAVERAAAGAGAGLALAADSVVIGNNASLLFPFLRLGLVPDWGLMGLVTRRAGPGPAMRIFAGGAPIKGAQAVAVNLADIAVDDAEVMPTALAEAARFAALPPAAFARMKAGLRESRESDPLNLAHEIEAQVACLTGREFVEGYAAFKEKRQPAFTATLPPDNL